MTGPPPGSLSTGGPPTGGPAPSVALLRADTQVLTGYIHAARAVAIGREQAIRAIKRWLLERMGIGVLVVFVLIIAVNGFPAGSGRWSGAALTSAYLLIALAARIGAIISIGRRVEAATVGNIMAGDAIYVLASLGLGRSGLRLSIWSATFFGLVLFALFASGVPAQLGLQGGLAPKICDVTRDEAQQTADRAAAAAAQLEQDARTKEAAAAAPSPALPQPALSEPVAPPAGAPAPAGTGSPPAVPADAAPISDAQAARMLADKAAADAKVLAAAAAIAGHQSCPASSHSGGGRAFLIELAAALDLASVTDFYKVLVWAFLAGFAERLVPDMLDTLTRRSTVNLKKEETASK